jgi:hypothetical protein
MAWAKGMADANQTGIDDRFVAGLAKAKADAREGESVTR